MIITLEEEKVNREYENFGAKEDAVRKNVLNAGEKQ